MAKIAGELITCLKYIHSITCLVYRNRMDYLVGSTANGAVSLLFLIDSSIAAQCAYRRQATAALTRLVSALRGIPTEQQSDAPPRADINLFRK